MKEFIKKIERINFGLMSPEDIRKMSVVRVETQILMTLTVIQLKMV